MNSDAEALGHAATQAPHPMHAAASIAASAASFGTRIVLASCAPPVEALMYPPDWMIRSNALRTPAGDGLTDSLERRHEGRAFIQHGQNRVSGLGRKHQDDPINAGVTVAF